jgi:sodium-dependent dicarboxylate transporter 2/3/5
MREAVSAAEERFERARRGLALWLGPVVGVVVWASGDDDPAQRLAGIMAFTAIWWIGEAIPVAGTALLSASLTVLFGVTTAKSAFAAFGTPLLFLFVGSFMLAEAMIEHRLGERLARAAYRVSSGRLGVMMALSAAACAMSMWMSNSAATAVFLPVALAVARADGNARFGAAMALAIAYGASVGGVGTPVGTPPNLIGIERMREAGIAIGFLRWMAIGVPMAAIMLVVLWVVLAARFGLRPGQRAAVEGSAVLAPRRWTRAEAITAGVFLAAVAGWFAPGIVEAIAPGSRASAWLSARLREEIVAILAAAALFVAPAGDGRRVLGWERAQRIDWGTVLLFGGGILLGDLAGTTGLAARWGDALIDATGASSLWSITALCIGVSILLSEATNNTATCTLMAPLALALASAAGVPQAPPVLGATLGASFGFMLPISTAPNAMAYGTGMVSIRQMVGAGVWFDAVGFLVILGGLRVLCPLLGLA